MVGQLEAEIAKRLAPTVEALVRQITPKVQALAAQAAEAAAPTVRQIVREDVLPKVLFWGGLAIVGGAAVAAAIGSYFATRR